MRLIGLLLARSATPAALPVLRDARGRRRPGGSRRGGAGRGRVADARPRARTC
ncbi:MAG: hypothetical protein MZW92_40365 [Comamonadaceae bacterium]|nr:hypothetical protein [Comamonadaceae bacterium]